MLRADRTVLILLAAGRSQRFGPADKLSQDLHGKPLALHAVAALDDLPFRARIAVTGNTTLDFGVHGFRTIRNDRPETGMSSSLRLGVAAAREMRADAVLVALADMPRITSDHIRRLLDAADGPDTIVASSGSGRPSPPAVFGAGLFDRLLALTGDEGARALIAGGTHIIAPAEEMIDVDRPDDLERLRTMR